MLLAFDDNGPGPVIVLLHGFPLGRWMWHAQVADLGGVYRLLTPDLRGHGETAAPEGIYTIDEMADDVIEWLDSLQITEPVVLGGLSMGGYVALSLVVRYPNRFRALMLMDTKAWADSVDAAANRLRLAQGVEESGDASAVIQGMIPRLFSSLTREQRPDVIGQAAEKMMRTNPRAVAGALRGMAERPDRTAVLGRITLPTLVLVGEDDIITPLVEAQAIAADIPGSTLVIIPHAGHMAPMENPAAVNRAIREFLNRLA